MRTSYIPWEEVKERFEQNGQFYITPSGGDYELPAPDGFKWVIPSLVGENISLVRESGGA